MDVIVDKAVEQVSRQAETIRSDEEQVISVMTPGDEVRQGDIYVTMLRSMPKGAKRLPMQAQLAPGNTQGSRHCLRSADGIALYAAPEAGPLDGPIIEAPNGCAIDHPEHGNIVLPEGVYAVTFQRAFAEELRRVAD